MSTMKAMTLVGHGGPEMLEYREDWPRPVAGAGEVLVRVGACGLNNTDINTRVGWYAADSSNNGAWGGAAIQFPRIQGADVCGIVEAVGAGADDSLIGKRVLIDTWLRDWDNPDNMEKMGYFGSECDGGFAEYTKIDSRHIHPIESPMSDAELATFATSYSTAEGMLNRADVGKNDRVLISGASGGVGSALIQLAKRRGAAVFAMCGESKHEAARELGADAVFSRAPDDLAGELSSAGCDSVSVVADVVGGEYWPHLINVIARGGRYVCSGAIAGAHVNFDLRPFYLRNLTFFGSTVLPPGVFADLVGYVARGEIRPLLAKTYPLAELNEAQRMFMAKEYFGNIVVIP